jgi:hypothetical protein
MKQLKETADEVPFDLRELVLGLDDESASETQVLPTNAAGLVDYSNRANPDPLNFDIADLLKGESDTEIRFSDLPIEIQLPMGVTETGEFVETYSQRNQAKQNLCARFVTQLQRLASQDTGGSQRGVLKRLAALLQGETSDLPTEFATAVSKFKESLAGVEAGR